jgi:DNA-binding PucR family transcriptional regulator
MLAVREPDIVLAVVDGMADLNELRGYHALIRRTLQPARQIFRTKNVFNRHDLGFVDNVLRIVAGGAETTRPYSSLVKKIREHGEDGAGRLYETLETLILDANMSTAATASLLYLHQHTVQYRLRKIKDLLGDDVFQVSTQFELATALAIQRLLEGKKQRK